MLGPVVVLLGILGLFLWWLFKNYSNTDEERSSRGGGSSRRGKKKRKNKQRHEQHPSTGAGRNQIPNVDHSATGVSGGDRRRRSLQQARGAGGKVLDAEDWPTLGGSPADQEEEEDLAALHAEMLKAKRSAAATADGNVSGVAGKGKLAAGGRNSGRIGVGDKVEGRFEAGTEWFPATVTKTLHGGLVNLLYDDGEAETRVPLSFVRHRGATADESSDSYASSDSDSSDKELHRPAAAQATKKLADGWEVMMQKPKKTRVERIESRVEANSNLKNRLKRQRKREKELAAREALRKKL
ncbi:unnamed protein product [Pylaiella littoralis]